MRSRHYITTVAAIAFAGSALAQETRPQQPQEREQDRWQQRDHDQQRDRQQMMQPEHMERMMMLHHADNDVINASVTNLEQENLGSIDALVIEVNTGTVAYAIVSFGGFLGIGDTLHAVPWNAFYQRPLYDGLILNVTRSQLERQEGFERDRMPNFADERWATTTHQHYGVQPYWEQRERRPMRDMRNDMPGQQQQPRQPMDDEPVYPGMEQRQYISTYNLIDITVENRQGEEVGTIRDFAMNLQTGEIEHVVMGYGGWLGIGETNTAMPWDVFQPQDLTTDDPRMLLDITREQLRDAPEYNMDHWPRPDSAQWAQHLRRDRTR